MAGKLGECLRKLPDFKGKRRLARMLLGKKVNSYHDFMVTGKYDCRFQVPNLTESIGLELFVNGIFEEEIIDFIVRKMSGTGVFIDLGANIGSVSLPIAKRLPRACIIAVEASPFVIPYLKKNIALNNISNIYLHEAAIAEKESQSLDFYYPVNQFGKGGVTNLFNAQSVKVKAITIDEIVKFHDLSKVDLIKIDIEGAEKLAFLGGKNLLSGPDAPSLLFEFVDYAEGSVDGLKPGDAQAFLMDLGYQLFLLDRGMPLALQKPRVSGYAMIWATKNNMV